MMDERSSDELYWQLMREGMRPTAVGAAKASNDRAAAPASGKQFRPNTTPKSRLRIIRARPFLAMIDGGKR